MKALSGSTGGAYATDGDDDASVVPVVSELVMFVVEVAEVGGLCRQRRSITLSELGCRR